MEKTNSKEVANSARWELKKSDFAKIGKGALIAAAGAILVYLGQWASGADFGSYTPAIVAIASIAINFGRKIVSNNQ